MCVAFIFNYVDVDQSRRFAGVHIYMFCQIGLHIYLIVC
jgi:hypothetical protein